jgi:hypothetical protein
MPELSDLEHKGLVQAFGLQPEEVADARYNLLGFFGVLYKIDQRLKKEAQEKMAAKEAGCD